MVEGRNGSHARRVGRKIVEKLAGGSLPAYLCKQQSGNAAAHHIVKRPRQKAGAVKQDGELYIRASFVYLPSNSEHI
jgi:hypothetical protein